MGKPTGFMEYKREDAPAYSVKERIKNFGEFHDPLSKEDQQKQGARCMDCGVPFCQAGMQIGSAFSGCPLNNLIPEWNDEGTRSPEEMVLITQSMKEVNQIMSTYVGIVRSDLRLKRAWDRLDIIYEETESLFKRSVASREICELRNMVNVGYLIMRQAMERKESRGLHYTIDYPHVKK